jgi:NTE family protein
MTTLLPRRAFVWLTLTASLVLSACMELPARQPGAGEAPYFMTSGARPRLALVLSSGSLRGFAHVGVLNVLEANDIHPDLIVGTSVGALVGAISASGRSAAELQQIVSADDLRLGTGLSRVSLGNERPSVHDFVERNLRSQRIERFPIAFAAVATDLQAGCLSVFNAGAAAIAVQASTGLPGVFAPTNINGRDYADGGMTSPVPVRVARALGAERVIAVDVTFPPGDSRLDSMIDRLFQMGLVMLRTLATQEAREADVLIEPVFPPVSEISLDNRAALTAVGERAALVALPQIRKLLAEPAAQRSLLREDVRWCDSLRPQITASGLRGAFPYE